MLTKEVDVTKFKKRNILISSGTYKTSLPKFLVLVLAISKGKKPNTISTQGQAALILERANVNSDSIFMEFIRIENSEVLKKRQEESTEKNKLMKDVIEKI